MAVRSKASVAVAQLGARMHYAVPRALARAEMLDRLYSDICGSRGYGRILGKLSSVVKSNNIRKLAGRVIDGVNAEQIECFDLFGLRYGWLRRSSKNSTELTNAHLWAGRTFGNKIVKQWQGRSEAIYVFDSAGLEVLRFSERRQLIGIMEQTIAPREIEMELLEGERERWPDYSTGASPDCAAQEFSERVREEWSAASAIICGSEFVVEGIRRCCGPVQKCVVIPYGVTVRNDGPRRDGRDRRGKLRVLFAGTVSLRKGVPYLAELAVRLKDLIEVVVVGPIAITENGVRILERCTTVKGAVPRSEIGRYFAWADIFVFPSMCEGSATVTYEALAHGLPVVTTPNAGSVVRDGIEGYVVGAGNLDQLVERVEVLARNEDVRIEMSRNAYGRARDFTAEEYGWRVVRHITKMLEMQ